MIKRPLDKRFSKKVITGIKVTTIRDKPWPVGKPILLYHWSGKPYCSKQTDVAAVMVEATTPISIKNNLVEMWYIPESKLIIQKPIWMTEGFDSQDEMDDWFRPLVNPGMTIQKHLMKFRLIK